VPIGAATVGIGALLFASGNSQAASVGRLLQGAGGVFALIGRGLHRHHELPRFPRRHAHRRDTDVRHGRRLGRPVRRRTDDRRGVSWSMFWLGMGIAAWSSARCSRAVAGVEAGAAQRRLAEAGRTHARRRSSGIRNRSSAA
jgi:hypothetical protein